MSEKKRRRRILPLILGIMMVISSLTVQSVNTVYASPDSQASLASGEFIRYDLTKEEDYQNCVEYIRTGLKNREESISFEVIDNYTSGDMDNLPFELFNKACAHNGNGDQGDYIRHQMSGYTVETLIASGYFYRYTFRNIQYFTTLEQEEEVTAECKRILDELKLDGQEDYCKIYKIYEYLCNNVVYDWDGLADESTDIEHSAYSALIRKTAVCQGYAVALYRLLLQAGVDARVITGKLEDGNHAWDIVKLEDKYYCLDATNDAGYSTYNHFLREDDYGTHKRAAKDYEEDFDTNYPISNVKYEMKELHYHIYGEPTWVWTGTSKANAVFTCTEDGCGHEAICEAAITSEVIKAATCEEKGSKKFTASIDFNGVTYTNSKKKTIAAKEHNYGAPTWTWTGTSKAVATFTCRRDESHYRKRTSTITCEVTKKATLTKAGTKTYTATATLDDKTYTSTKDVAYYLFDKSKNGLQNYDGVLYYARKGVRDTEIITFAEYKGYWYYVYHGKVNTTLKGIYKGKVNGTSGSWYVKNGRVQLTYSGTVKIDGKNYKIEKGKVVK